MKWMEGLQGKRALLLLGIMLAVGIALVVLSYAWPQSGQVGKAVDVALVTSTLEERLSGVLARIDGAGNVSVLIHEGEDTIIGVLVVAQGAGELTVRSALTRAAMTALDVPASCVEVFAMQETIQEGESK